MKVTLALCLLVVLVSTVNAGLLGGWGDEENATSDIQEFANEAKKSIESSAGVIKFPRFTVISYKRQVVSGTKFIMKIEVNNGRYIHVSMFRSLGGLVTSVKVKTGKKRDDPLEVF